ncbi:hypothetical protein [Cellulomonas chengniuliangii]|uniref:Uncharacterized protein n=1 Tax=Cellulomonas chengniuliangii TaxID=2968084 RepID=A0ABY5L0P2_9CELL|nr:hypothetical protein [Cellulomonas chengniuliangii]MCC2310083.1 hypothetical protein [Cellulomonas chengniuliangii]UUI76249.1 hypothetical protein NP064_04945 [Cellulomonas chengniuliangii]
MLHRLTAAVLSALGLLVMGLGVASATVWRGDDVLVATATPDDGTQLLVADPGVLEMAGDPVTVTVEASGDTPVAIAIGRDTDVAGWVGQDAHLRVTGLAAWDQLRTEEVEGSTPAPTAEDVAEEPEAPPAEGVEAAPADEAAAEPAVPAADPRGSDLWVAEASGNGSATLTWTDEPGRWSLLVASVGSEPPTLTLSWPRTVTTPWLVPSLAVGGLLLVVGILLGVRQWRRGRRGATEAEWHPVHTGAIPAVTGTVGSQAPTALTRRQLRELQAAGPGVRARDERQEPSEAATRPGPSAPAASPSAQPSAWADRPGATSASSPSTPASSSSPATPAGTPWGAAPGRREVDAGPARPAAPSPAAASSAAPHAPRSPEAPSADRSRRPSWLQGRPADEAPAAASVPPPAHVNGPGARPAPGSGAASDAPEESRRRRDLPTLGSRWVSRGAERQRPVPSPEGVPAEPHVAAQADGPARPTSRAELRRGAGDGRRSMGWGSRPEASPEPVRGPVPPTGARPDDAAARPGPAAGTAWPVTTPQPTWSHVGAAEGAAPRADAWRRAWGIPGETAPADDEPGRDPEESERR